MPTGPSTAGGESPVRLETEGAAAGALEGTKETPDVKAKTSKGKGRSKSQQADHSSEGECLRGERYAIYVEVERDRRRDRPVLIDRTVPAYAWTEEIIKDHVERCLPDLTDVIILSPMACLLFRGRRSVGEGLKREQAEETAEQLGCCRCWAGKDVEIHAVPVTLTDAKHTLVKARDFVRKQTRQKLSAAKGVPAEKLTASEAVTARGRGMVKRADKYFAKTLAERQVGLGEEAHTKAKADRRIEKLLRPLRTLSGVSESDEEPYESAVETGADTGVEAGAGAYSDVTSLYDSTDDEEDYDDVVGYDTETSHQVTVAERNKQRKKQQQRRERRERRRIRDRRHRGATLPLFKNSQKEGAMAYTDWRNAVDELIEDKIPLDRVKSLALQSLEGPPKDTARLANKVSKGDLNAILTALDKTYGRSASYVHLQSEICSIQQLHRESVQDYYQRLVRLQVAIQDKFPSRLDELELERTAQEAFYNGLRDEFKPLISHLLDNPGITVTDLVEAVRRIEATQERRRIIRQDAFTGYPASTSAGYQKPSYSKGYQKDSKPAKTGVINAKPVQYEDDGISADDAAARSEEETEEWKDGYYVCAIRQAEEAQKFFGACFNCREPEHHWRDCTQPLRPGLQEIKDRIGQEGDRLNLFGDGGAKGGRVPQKGQRGAAPGVPAKSQK